MIDPTPDELERWRMRADALADDTISALFSEHTLAEANQVLSTLVLNDQPEPPGMPLAVRHYLFLSGRLPAWADPALIKVGQEVFADRGPLILLSLVTCSLAECYALGNGVQVLATTHRMDGRHIYRRIYETAQFIIDVCQQGGLEPTGRGLRAIQKVRLMHGSIRHLLLCPVPKGHDHHSRRFSDVLLGTSWDTAKLGLPLCFEDQAYTQLSFGWITLRSLERFGTPCSEREKAGWMHLWAVVGHLLGLPDRLLARTPEEGARLYVAIREHQTRSTRAGRQLTAALGAVVAEKLDSPWLGPRITTFLLRWLCDAGTLHQVGVRPFTAEERWLVDVLRKVIGWVFHDPEDRLRDTISVALVDRLTRLPREWQRGLFAIPMTLQTRWRDAAGRRARLAAAAAGAAANPVPRSP